MAVAIVLRGSVGQPARIVSFADRDEAEAYVALTGARHQALRTGDERFRTGELLAAEYLDVKEAVKAQGPGFAKQLNDLVAARVEDRAELGRRKAEQLRQQAEQRAAEQHEREIAEAVQAKAAEADRARILAWREEAELEAAGAT